MILDTTAAAQFYCTAYWTYFSFDLPVKFPKGLLLFQSLYQCI